MTPEQRREEILGAYQERISLRGIVLTFKVSRNTVTAWIKKRGERAGVSGHTV